jgi:hypothetical protein
MPSELEAMLKKSNPLTQEFHIKGRKEECFPPLGIMVPDGLTLCHGV